MLILHLYTRSGTKNRTLGAHFPNPDTHTLPVPDKHHAGSVKPPIFMNSSPTADAWIGTDESMHTKLTP
jgi:hypothetical protein